MEKKITFLARWKQHCLINKTIGDRAGSSDLIYYTHGVLCLQAQHNNLNPSIFYLLVLAQSRGAIYPSWHWVKAGFIMGLTGIDKQPHTLTFTPINLNPELGENPHKYRENVHEHRKTPARYRTQDLKHHTTVVVCVVVWPGELSTTCCWLVNLNLVHPWLTANS